MSESLELELTNSTVQKATVQNYSVNKQNVCRSVRLSPVGLEDPDHDRFFFLRVENNMLLCQFFQIQST